MNTTCAAVLAFILAALGASPASAACSIGKLADLPVTMSGLQPYIHAKLDGVDLRLLVDSGAFFSTITPSTARELKLKTTPAPDWYQVRGVGGVASVGFTTAFTLSLGEIPLRNVGFIVAGSGVGEDLGGLIGRNLLNYADIEYDLANGAIRMMRPSGCETHSLAYWATGKTYGVADSVSGEGRFPATLIPVEVNGVKLRALLDSGASTSVIYASAASRTGIKASGDDNGESRITGIGQRTTTSFVAPIDDFKVGGEEIKHTRIRVLASRVDEEDMLLGADFFLAHRVFVATSQHKVYFTYNGGPVFNLVAKPVSPAEPSGKETAATAPAPGEPADADGFSRRGEAFASRGDYTRALADLDRAVALAPTNAEYLSQRAVLRSRAGKGDLALADVEQSMKLRPDDAETRLMRARLRLKAKDVAGANADLDAVARASSPGADIRFALAELYNAADRDAEALPQFAMWLSAHREDARAAQALNGMCWTRALLNQDIDKAIAACDEALLLSPHDPMILDSRGLARFRRGDNAGAIADFDSALAKQPKQAWSLYGRGLAKLSAGDSAGGKADLAAAAAISPNIAARAAKYGLKP